MKRMRILFFLFILVGINITYAQKKTEIGIRIGYASYQLRGQGLIGKYFIFNDQRDAEGSVQIGLFSRWYHSRRKIFFEPGLYYSSTFENRGVINTKPQDILIDAGSFTYYERDFTLLGEIVLIRKLELPLKLSYILWQPWHWLNIRLHAGLMPGYLFRTKTSQENKGDLVFGIFYWTEQYLFNRFALDSMFGLGIDIGPVTLDVTRINSLTNLSGRGLDYEGLPYQLVQTHQQTLFNIGYKFPVSKRKNQK